MAVKIGPEVDLYLGLHPEDRAMVDLFTDTGVALDTALLNSGVLYPREERMYSSRGSGTEWERMNDPSRRLQRTAEHEAAHAVVALALGARVWEISVEPDGSGKTWHDGESPRVRAPIAAAGDVWVREFRAAEFPGDASVGCGADFRVLVRHAVGVGAVGYERRRAWEILNERRNAVMALSRSLLRSGRLSFLTSSDL
ncbi:M50 family metallopeptidase [Candidatus Protofrankia californiensis]|uniref:M50 family metallopeptidase n=1 Tax=Candidatus Protofrankia californiensis TaxID=1839754 RepID=UPI001041B17E|nr:M50 family metallopeptidase [Candidatus Protofrankia californiensis]